MMATPSPPAPSAPNAPNAAALTIDGISVSYGANRVLNDINIDVKPGEFFALLGPSGCGKTTLLRLIAGFANADSGEIRIAGKPITHLPPWKRDVGMVFQSYALWPHMSVARNVAFGLEERRITKSEVADRVRAALDLVGLSGFADRKPAQLSGGQQQRVALARTIAIEPKILLLDEPLSNLDAKLRVQVRRELRELQQRLGLTTILVTHDQEEANTICDRVAVMNHGVVQQVGRPKDVYEQPNNLFVANFLGTANIIEGRMVGIGEQRQFEAADGLRLPIPPGVDVPAGARIVFRPQDLRIVPAGASTPDTATITGQVTFCEFLGASVRYNVRAGVTDLAVDMPFHAGDTLHAIGHPVTLSLDASSVRWLTA
jgi:iron(III) transport system ATP-binding protein